MATEKSNESLVEMKLTKTATEKRIFDLNQLINDSRNQHEAIGDALRQKTITAKEYRISVKEIEQHQQPLMAELDQQKQKLKLIHWAINSADRSKL